MGTITAFIVIRYPGLVNPFDNFTRVCVVSFSFLNCLVFFRRYMYFQTASYNICCTCTILLGFSHVTQFGKMGVNMQHFYLRHLILICERFLTVNMQRVKSENQIIAKITRSTVLIHQSVRIFLFSSSASFLIFVVGCL